MQTFLNELSLPTLTSSSEVVKLFDAFGICYKKARELGARDVKISSSFYSHAFAPSYSYVNWLADHNANEDLRTLLNSVLGTTPFVDDIKKVYEFENSCELKMSYNKTKCLGLGFASDIIYDTVAFSFDSNKWNSSSYKVLINQCTIDEECNIEESETESNSNNISNINHVNNHQDFINSKIASTIESGSELWLRRTDLFPNLIFCDNVKSQISSFNANSLGFNQIILKLFELQNTANKCTGRGIKPEDFSSHTTPESDTRLRKFKNELTISCPDNEYRLFSWHSRYTPGAGRIHFFPIEKEKKFIIGSIANQNLIK